MINAKYFYTEVIKEIDRLIHKKESLQLGRFGYAEKFTQIQELKSLKKTYTDLWEAMIETEKDKQR